MEIKIRSYEKATFTSETGGPVGGYDYKAPDGTLWNVDAVENTAVRLWTVNAWGQTHRQSVNVYEFERTWTRYGADTPALTKRLSWRTKADQFYQSFGCGQAHVIRYMGTCEVCGRSVYSHGCIGSKPCGDLITDSPDPRGIIPETHCLNLYHAREYDLKGRDLMTCAACADDGDKYRSLMAAAKSTGTWTPARSGENNDCCGNGPHASGQVRVMPLAGGANLILCRRCWESELRYRRDRNRTLADFAKFTLPAWEDSEVYGAEK